MGLSVNITKKLPDFSLNIHWEIGNELAVLFGDSGAGKSMTLRCIAGLAKPDAGQISVNGDIFFDAQKGINVLPQERSLGYVFQDCALFPHMDVAGNIAYGLSGLRKPEVTDRVAETISRFHLEGLEKSYPGEISGGQKQRVALARALISRPKALLLDEPFSGLHQGLRKEFWFLLKELQVRHQLTVIMITHDLEEAFFLGDHIGILIDGMVHQSASKENSRIPKDKTVASLYGIKNVFPAVFTAQNLLIPTLNLSIPIHAAWPPPPRSSEKLEVGIRSEDLIIYDMDRQNNVLRQSPEVLSLPTLHGRITACFEKGHSATLFFSPLNSDALLEVEIPYHKTQKLLVREGMNLALAIPPDRLFLLTS